MDHVIRSGQIQADTTGLEAQQEQIALATLEGIRGLLAGLAARILKRRRFSSSPSSCSRSSACLRSACCNRASSASA